MMMRNGQSKQRESERAKKFKSMTMRQFDFEGIKLDLSYINNRLVVLGSPYRNDNLKNVQRFLEAKHSHHYRILNFTNEHEYNPDQDLPNVETYPFPKGNPCPLHLLIELCTSIDGYLHSHEENIIVFHSTDGKGRSCHIAACYLLHCGQFDHAAKALDCIASQRYALSIPSQIRYIYYYEKLLRTDRVLLSTFRMMKVRCLTVPEFNTSLVHSGCTPYLEVFSYVKDKASQGIGGQVGKGGDWAVRREYNGREHAKKYLTKLHKEIVFDLQHQDLTVRGDVCLMLCSEGKRMCQAFFNTSFIDNQYLRLEREVIDIAHADKSFYTFHPQFTIEISFQRVNDSPDMTLFDGSVADAMIERERSATALSIEEE